MNIKPLKPFTATRETDDYYQSPKHKMLRSRCVSEAKGVCQGCKCEGRVHSLGKYATGDHIIPRKTANIDLATMPVGFNVERWENLKKEVKSRGFDIPENYWAVCKKYHDKKSAKEKRR